MDNVARKQTATEAVGQIAGYGIGAFMVACRGKHRNAAIIVLAGAILLLRGSFIHHFQAQTFVQFVGTLCVATGLLGWLLNSAKVGRKEFWFLPEFREARDLSSSGFETTLNPVQFLNWKFGQRKRFCRWGGLSRSSIGARVSGRGAGLGSETWFENTGMSVSCTRGTPDKTRNWVEPKRKTGKETVKQR
jgi:hypothetical protein